MTSLIPAFNQLIENKSVIEAWFAKQWQRCPAPLYASVDLRNAGFKVAPVDTNLFSGGFNNLASENFSTCVAAMRATLQRHYPDVKTILLIPENHTRNTYYLENIAVLSNIIHEAGYSVTLGSLAVEVSKPTDLTTANDKTITLFPIERVDNKLQANHITADLVMLNNDLSTGLPELLLELDQPIVPNPSYGWNLRLKSTHFKHYTAVAKAFATEFNIDPWLIDSEFAQCDQIDFMASGGVECLVSSAEILFEKIHRHYQQHHVTDSPFVVVKADAGIYGMGVMSVNSAKQLAQLNRKQRTHMAKTKGKMLVDKVILQEGVPTIDRWAEDVAEPVIYLIGEQVVGGFYRMNNKRGITENLNSPGMHFMPMSVADTAEPATLTESEYYLYGIIARLAALASAKELCCV